MTGDIRKYYDLQKRLNFSLLSLFNLFSTFYSMAANEGHKKPNVQLSSKSIFKRKSQSKNHKSFYALGIWFKKSVYNLKSQNKWSISEARKIKFGILTNFQLVTLTTPHSTLHPPPPHPHPFNFSYWSGRLGQSFHVRSTRHPE